jgi:multidrug efflux pump subunit AcrB
MIMLFASLVESALILPSHLLHTIRAPKWLRKIFGEKETEENHHWMNRVEQKYLMFLEKILRKRIFVFLCFLAIFALSIFIYQKYMKFVMFPREEALEFTIRATAPEDTTRLETAKLTEPLEAIFVDDPRRVVISVLTFIGQNRRGGEVKENEATLRVEVVPASDRDISLNDLIDGWDQKVKQLQGFEKIRFMKDRWGSDSGSPIDIEIQENDDTKRAGIVKALYKKIEDYPGISNVEIEKPVVRDEYRLNLKREEVFNLGINPKMVGASLRAFVEGEILYTVNKGEEEVDVRLTTHSKGKIEIENILNLQASNSEDYLIPIKSLVSVEEVKSPANIQRINYKRTTKIYADLKEGAKTTPLDIANYLEKKVFPEIEGRYQNVIFKFRGEIEESRESREDFLLATILSLLIIYLLLVLLYNSIVLPFLIGAIIPFGVIGVIFAFFGQDMTQYGFFAVVGTLGMMGVVINDSIVMISRLEETIDRNAPKSELLDQVARISSTRLRAVTVTTLTTVAGLFPTAYGWMGYDSMLSEMMLAMGWGLLFGTLITLLLVPCLYSFYIQVSQKIGGRN